MNNQDLRATVFQVYQLMKAAQGNIFNCMYIDCTNCNNTKDGFCGDFIFSILCNGSPILLPISDINLIQGFSQDKSDFLGIISSSRFSDLFFLFLIENTSSDTGCPITALFTAQKVDLDKFVKYAQ